MRAWVTGPYRIEADSIRVGGRHPERTHQAQRTGETKEATYAPPDNRVHRTAMLAMFTHNRLQSAASWIQPTPQQLWREKQEGLLGDLGVLCEKMFLPAE